MNACPICGEPQDISSFAVITRKKKTCLKCKNDLIFVESPSSILVRIPYLALFLLIYAVLRQYYGLWIRLLLLPIFVFVILILESKIPRHFTIVTTESLELTKRLEKINLLLLIGFIVLFVSVLYFF